MQSTSRTNRRSRKQKPLWGVKERRALIAIGIVFLILCLGFNRFLFREIIRDRKNYQAYIDREIPDSLVCMVNNTIKRKAIDSLVVSGKTYWGCCSDCKSKLAKNENNILFAVDPISGNQLSKADAVIHRDPLKRGKVMYFESEESYKKFKRKSRNVH